VDKIIQNKFLIQYIDELSLIKSPIHLLNPFIKFITTLIFLIFTTSFDKYEIIKLFPYFIYPFFLIIFSNIPIRKIVKKIIFFEPFIIIISLFNIFFSNSYFTIFNFKFSSGWIIFFSIIIRTTLSLLTIIIFVSVTGISNIIMCLKILKIPDLLILQILLTYRYISILIEEVYRIMIAFSIRSIKNNGLPMKIWGSLIGQLLIRTFERAEKIYYAMISKGFKLNFKLIFYKNIKLNDLIFFVTFIIYFIIFRFIDFSKFFK